MEKQQAEDDAQKAVEMHKKGSRSKACRGPQECIDKVFCLSKWLDSPRVKSPVAATTTASESLAKNKKADLTAQLYREPSYSRVQA
jgi:hypothetical protein